MKEAALAATRNDLCELRGGRSPQRGPGAEPLAAPNEVKGEPPLELFQAEAEAVQRLLPAQEESDLNGAAGGHLFAGQGDAHGP